jgi:hypothetical protein
MHYLPLSPAFFAILVVLFLLLVALIQVGILRYPYMRLGVVDRHAIERPISRFRISEAAQVVPACRSRRSSRQGEQSRFHAAGVIFRGGGLR